MRRFWCIALFLGFSTFAQTDGSLNIELLSHYPMSYASDVWGWEDSVTGRRFAFVGSFSSTYIFDITDPRNPILIDSVPGAGSIWRDMKVWKERLYVVHDIVYSGSPSGLQVVNLRVLADSNRISFRNTSPGGIKNAHNIFIDEEGRAWLWGSTPGNNYVIDLTNPDSPQFLTDYTIGGGIDPYIHDGFVRNDTVWGGHIYAGKAAGTHFQDSLLSFSFIGSISTPYQFTHNVWLSNNGKYMFTTDETAGAPIGIYDVSSPSTPQLLATFQSSRHPAIPHNVFYKNGFIYISYYTEGVVVADVRVPDLPVEVAWYDTSPFSSASFKGCWGVYPFFDDSVFIASDMERGLFVLKARWNPAIRIYVRVFRDSVNGPPAWGKPVRIISPTQLYSSVTDVEGMVKAGFTDSGLYRITISLQDTFLAKEINVSYGVVDTIDFIIPSFVATGISESTYDNSYQKCLMQSGTLKCPIKVNIQFFSFDGKLISSSVGEEFIIPLNAAFVCIDGRCNKIPRINVY
ncbi:MAG: hypothetical protein GXO48_06100 [Chlorobi bacterium]|nr:hypothetical protein [Chlorobiota bacterium]